MAVELQLSWEDLTTGTLQQRTVSVPVAFGRDEQAMRSAMNDQDGTLVVLAHKQVSRCHALIVQQDEGLELVDKSTNGTFLNGQHFLGTNRQIQDGDRFQIGPYKIALNTLGTLPPSVSIPITPDSTAVLPGIYHDSLTGLPNRNMFMSLLQTLWERLAVETSLMFAVVHIDIDRLQQVNDSLGYRVGDKLLAAIARRLRQRLSPGDTAVRLEGDEFALLLENITHQEGAIGLIEALQRDLAAAFTLENQEAFITVSVGITFSHLPVNQPEDWLRFARTATNRAKQLGRGRLEIFRPGMEDSGNRLRLETDLSRAIERGELSLRYQPIVSLTSGQIVGFEALVRWQHPEAGWIPSDQLIAIAEETGLIIPIGLWVLQTACQQLCRWQKQFPDLQPLTVSVNVSSKQFIQTDLVAQITQVLQETDLPGNHLKLELTESLLMESESAAIAMLSQLQELGVQILMDDFGTGYSNLARMRNLPTDVVKVDKSLIQSLDAQNLAFVRGIVALAHSLSKTVVVEGIETQEQLAQLREMDCAYGQGYLFSPPVDIAQVENLLSQSPHW
ncbi:response regulator receiver modulated diguanylate cyclase/phosphodiesterase with PAS/PAC sensor(s) [Gloeomargarita lithophora Alchichica-D10]|uniref:Response regulator receiver modulated diguanylate cyclase/phosphodiesterase with PAS/PAC sensor(S) n=2 Tax=Gloeomargarita TaxID=1188227 RepID=A0A1J0A980_9CYAN|nr:response regulator receiver modulated diguanylate cyclase/phosphodiesterase with PAS/PAC sensor(s) [Gloeomargarita lithophora Alchichica-D10]